MAPEIAAGEGHTFSADWFSLGALLYEMLWGLAPHFSENQNEMLENRIKCEIKMRKNFSKEASDLLKGLLHRNPNQRLKEVEIRLHPFFNEINWQHVK